MNDFPRRLHHKTPEWVKSGALFHVRVRTAQEQKVALTEPMLVSELLAAARRYQELGKWWCELFLIMPDHWHALLAFPSEPGMAATIRDWKRGTARFQGVNWQDNFFDHRIRNPQEAEEKWHYIRKNPVVKGFCVNENDWPWSWSCMEGGAN